MSCLSKKPRYQKETETERERERGREREREREGERESKRDRDRREFCTLNGDTKTLWMPCITVTCKFVQFS